MKLHRCIECHMANNGDPLFKRHENPSHFLPRKKKKLSKKIMYLFNDLDDIFGYVDLCDLPLFYKHSLKYRMQYKFLCKNRNIINKILNVASICSEPMAINVNNKYQFEFVWLYEYDNGLYTESGYMPLIYNEVEKDDTWSYDETIELIKYLDLDPTRIKNHKQLITQFKLKHLS